MKREEVFSSIKIIEKSLRKGFGVVVYKNNNEFIIYDDPKTNGHDLACNLAGARRLHGKENVACIINGINGMNGMNR